MNHDSFVSIFDGREIYRKGIKGCHPRIKEDQGPKGPIHEEA